MTRNEFIEKYRLEIAGMRALGHNNATRANPFEQVELMIGNKSKGIPTLAEFVDTFLGKMYDSVVPPKPTVNAPPSQAVPSRTNGVPVNGTK